MRDGKLQTLWKHCHPQNYTIHISLKCISTFPFGNKIGRMDRKWTLYIEFLCVVIPVLCLFPISLGHSAQKERRGNEALRHNF
jgi:hypothetical protein